MPRRRTKVTVPVASPKLVVPGEHLVTPPPGGSPPASNGSAEGSLINLPTVSVTGSPFDVDLTAGGRLKKPPVLVKVGNVTPFLMLVTLGGQQDHLRPWETNVFPAFGATTMHVTPVALTSTAVPGGVVANLVVAVSTEGVAFPGSWPIMNSHLGQQGYGFGQVLALAGVTGTQTGSFPIPPGTQSISIVTVVPSGTTSHLTLVGATTGFDYYSQVLGSSAFELIGVDSTSDSVLDYTAIEQSGGAPGISWFISALPTPPPGFIQRTPALYEVPRNYTPINQGIPHGGSFTWVTPAAGMTLRLFYMSWRWRTSTAGFGTLKGSGATGGILNYDQVATNFLDHDFHGFQLAVNETLVVENNDTGNGQNINGGIGWSPD